jgi:hypothetical protein
MIMMLQVIFNGDLSALFLKSLLIVIVISLTITKLKCRMNSLGNIISEIWRCLVTKTSNVTCSTMS